MRVSLNKQPFDKNIFYLFQVSFFPPFLSLGKEIIIREITPVYVK